MENKCDFLHIVHPSFGVVSFSCCFDICLHIRLETTGGKEKSFPTSLEKEKENEKLRLSLTAMTITNSYDDHYQLWLSLTFVEQINSFDFPNTFRSRFTFLTYEETRHREVI